MNCQEDGAIAAGFGMVETWTESTVVVAVSGDLDVLTAPGLGRAISAAILQKPAVLIVDLSGVGFLASAGMSELIDASEHVAVSTRFAVVAEGSATGRLLRLIGLDTVFALYSTVDEALRDTGGC